MKPDQEERILSRILRLKKWRGLSYLLFVLTLCSSFVVFISFTHTKAADRFGQNIALGKSYVFSIPPDYPGCTDAGDSTQLTDGNYVRGILWNQPGTVGWYNHHSVEITFDLGATKPIEGVAFDTAAAARYVSWPSAIFMFVSDDNVTWHAVGNLTELDLANSASPNPFTAFAVHQYKTMALATHGRYVKLVVSNLGNKQFSDEVEIYRGHDADLSLPLQGSPITDTAAYIIGEIPPSRARSRLLTDIRSVNDEITAGNFSSAVADPLRRSLSSIGKQVSTITTLPSTFTTVFPINDLHRQIFAVQSAVWRALGFRSIVPWKSGRWDPLFPTGPPMKTAAAMDVSMMQNEYRADTFNLSNAGTDVIDLTLTVEGLPGGSDPNYVSVREVPFTDSISLIPVADVLPEVGKLNGHYAVQIPAGLTRQIWLSFHPTDLAAGTYHGTVKVGGSGVTTFTVPITLRIYPLTFPQKPTLHLGGWDYTDKTVSYGVGSGNQSAFIANLKEHYVDTPWATSDIVLPTGSYDSKGHMTTAPNPSVFNTWVARWPDASNYFVSSSSHYQIDFAGFPIGSTAFNEAVKEWTAWWAAYLQSKNILPGKLGLLLVDEPYTSAQDDIIIAYGNALRSAGTAIRIFEDATWMDPSAGNPHMFEVSDILSPNLLHFILQGKTFRDFYTKQQTAGRELWLYATSGPRRLFDPYLNDELPGWFAWQYGAKGVESWAFGDTGYGIRPLYGNSWNEYVSTTISYTPLFLDAQSVTDGKHMEAIREGIEDYEYLRMLHDRVVALEAAGINHPAISDARTLLDSAPSRVTNGGMDITTYPWSVTKDRSVADKVRVEILTSLERLSLFTVNGGDQTPRVITTSKKNVTVGDTLIQNGKHFSMNSQVALNFCRPDGTYNPRLLVKTDGSGSFHSSYLIKADKAKGRYSWFALDMKTGKSSKKEYYTVR